MKLSFIAIIVLILIFTCVEARAARRSGSRRSAKAGVIATGNYMGNSLVGLINIFREKPTPMPKNYKRSYDPPPKEEHTFYGKFKKGLKNFIYLGYLLVILTVSAIVYKIYRFGLRQYYRFRLGSTPASQWRQLTYYREQLKAMDSSSQVKTASPALRRIR